jgi:hypothetical protein
MFVIKSDSTIIIHYQITHARATEIDIQVISAQCFRAITWPLTYVSKYSHKKFQCFPLLDRAEHPRTKRLPKLLLRRLHFRLDKIVIRTRLQPASTWLQVGSQYLEMFPIFSCLQDKVKRSGSSLAI